MADNHEWADANGLTVSRRSRDGVLIVAARGEIDLNSCAPLAQALVVPREVTAPRTVIDLSGVTFMDSTGINLLIGADRAARGARGLAAPGRPHRGGPADHAARRPGHDHPQLPHPQRGAGGVTQPGPPAERVEYADRGDSPVAIGYP